MRASWMPMLLAVCGGAVDAPKPITLVHTARFEGEIEPCG